jgi:hypothetical protein
MADSEAEVASITLPARRTSPTFPCAFDSRAPRSRTEYRLNFAEPGISTGSSHGFSAAYNKVVVSARHQNDSHKHQRHAIYATETSGLLLIAFLLLALTLIRYWHTIHWSVR